MPKKNSRKKGHPLVYNSEVPATEVIRIRVTPLEKQLIEMRSADSAGGTISSYVREKLDLNPTGGAPSYQDYDGRP